MTDQFDVSIIIPSHNRPSCLYHTIHACLLLGEGCEIIICDSSDVPSSLQSLGIAGRSNVQLKINPPSFSVVDNFNSGVQLARGRYMLFIGDDDFVSSGIFAAIGFATANDVDCMSLRTQLLIGGHLFNIVERGSCLHQNCW